MTEARVASSHVLAGSHNLASVFYLMSVIVAQISQSALMTLYRVGQVVADLGWVDLDLGSSPAGGPLL